MSSCETISADPATGRKCLIALVVRDSANSLLERRFGRSRIRVSGVITHAHPGTRAWGPANCGQPSAFVFGGRKGSLD